MHILYEIKTDIPTFFHITEAKVLDQRPINKNLYEQGVYYVFEPAPQVFRLYKKRWHAELFNKNKQHLKIKYCWGTTETSVRIQIYSAITIYCMAAIVENSYKLNMSTYGVLKILNSSLLDKTPIKELFTKESEYVVDDGQLSLIFMSGH